MLRAMRLFHEFEHKNLRTPIYFCFVLKVVGFQHSTVCIRLQWWGGPLEIWKVSKVWCLSVSVLSQMFHHFINVTYNCEIFQRQEISFKPSAPTILEFLRQKYKTMQNSLDKNIKQCKTTKHFWNQLKSVLISEYKWFHFWEVYVLCVFCLFVCSMYCLCKFLIEAIVKDIASGLFGLLFLSLIPCCVILCMVVFDVWWYWNKVWYDSNKHTDVPELLKLNWNYCLYTDSWNPPDSERS